ncbi:MAG: hypothetical protein Q4B16_08500 [Bacteroidia bacterium]|nr:hypothetical protein [Bacteroidia bacterium]
MRVQYQPSPHVRAGPAEQGAEPCEAIPLRESAPVVKRRKQSRLSARPRKRCAQWSVSAMQHTSGEEKASVMDTRRIAPYLAGGGSS